MQCIGRGVEGDGAIPNGFELLDDDRVGEEVLGRCTDGNFKCRRARGSQGALGFPGGSAGNDFGRAWETLEGVEVVSQRINQLAGRVLFKHLQRQKLADLGSSVADSCIGGIPLTFLVELQAVGHESIQGGSRKVLGADLLLHRLDEELRDLRRAQLLPSQGRFGSRRHYNSNSVGYVIDREGICDSSRLLVGNVWYTKSQALHTKMTRREERNDGQATGPLLLGVGQVIHGVLVILVRAVAVIETLFKVILVLFFVVVGLCKIGGCMYTGRELARWALGWWRRAVGLLKAGTTLSAVAGGEHGTELERARQSTRPGAPSGVWRSSKV